MNNMSFKELNLNKQDIVYLTLLLIIGCLITINMINFNQKIGIYCADVIVYYFNSLNFAGMNPQNLLGNSNMFLSPFLCFLTSLLVRVGVRSELSILITTGILAIIGNIGLYILLKNKFSSLLSFTGAVFYSSLSIMLIWWSNGTFDIPTVSISIWVIIFTIIAIDKNPKYYILALPLFVLALFSRYTAGFMLPLMLLYFFQKHDFFKNLDNLISDRKKFKNDFSNFFKSDEFKYIAVGIVISVILSIIIIEAILLSESPLTFITQTKDSVTGFKGHVNDHGYNTNILFYLENFLNFLFSNKIIFDELNPSYTTPSPIAYLISLIVIFGLIIKVSSLKVIKTDFNTENYEKILKSILIILIVAAIIGVKISFLVSDIAILVIALIVSTLTEKYTSKLSILMISWFLIYFIFFSINSIKLDRYMITLMPAIAYLFIYCLNEILNRFDKIRMIKLIPVILVLIFIVSAVNFTENFENPQTLANINDTYDFLVEYDSDLLTKDIISQSYRYGALYLHKNMTPVKSEHMKHLDSNNYTYLILNNKNTEKYNDELNKNFENIYHNKDYNIFKRK